MFKELIWVKKNSLPKTFCDKVIEKFEKEPRKHDGVVGSNSPRVDKSMKDTTDINITNISGWEEEDKIFYKALQDAYLSNPELNAERKNISVSEEDLKIGQI